MKKLMAWYCCASSTAFSTRGKCLIHDKDVFVEKPLALRAEEGRELVQLASERNRILMVGHILEYHPAM